MMSFEVPPVSGGPGSLDPARRHNPDQLSGRGFRVADADASDSAPHAEAIRDVERAAEVVRELHARGRELRFSIDDGRVRIALCDLDGNVLRNIPVHEALDIADARRPAE
jgi:hypothetical protein